MQPTIVAASSCVACIRRVMQRHIDSQDTQADLGRVLLAMQRPLSPRIQARLAHLDAIERALAGTGRDRREIGKACRDRMRISKQYLSRLRRIRRENGL
jgi:hypothetical protein